MNVHLSGDWSESSKAALRDLLPPGVAITSGALPEPADFQILVAGSPSLEALRASSELEALVIPFAGLPAPTRTALSSFPGLAVHNLHHNAPAVAEMAIALLLAAGKRLLSYDKALRAGDWSGRYKDDPALSLDGKTALVLGFGAVGSRVVRACKGLGMKTVAVTLNTRPLGPEGPDEFRAPAELRELLPRSHALLVCLPRTPLTDGWIGEQELDLLPEGAVLVNVGRGAIVREDALYRGLKKGKPAAAGIDVWYRYPKSEGEAPSTPPSSLPFHELDNVVMSPHRAGHVAEDELLRMRALAELLAAATRGEPMPNRVDVEAGY